MKKNKVLIIEDDPELRESWEMFFENFGFSINTATNGLEAVEIISDYPFEIIVTDLQMPVKDGYFVLECLKSEGSDIKVWVCTGDLIVKDKILENYKVDKILLKPFDMLGAVKEIISIISENNADKI